MYASAALLAIGCVLLVASGSMKVIRPLPVVGAMRSLGVMATTATGRALGIFELLLGSAGLVVSAAWLAWIVGLAYFGFAVVLVALIRRGEGTTCGCFGAASSPAHPAHAVIDVALGIGAAMAGFLDAPSWFDAVVGQQALGVGFSVVVVVGVVTCLVVMTRIGATTGGSRG